MRKGGRRAELIGVRARDLRIRYLSPGGHSRGFYARWRPNLRTWECQLSGYSMRPKRWFAPTQTLALAELRLTACLWSWRRVFIDRSPSWDGIWDTGFVVGNRGQLDLFAEAA